MKRIKYYRTGASLLVLAALFVLPIGALAQTQVKAPSNKYSVADDVKLGREAAAEVERQMPVIRDRNIDNYIDQVGRRLVENIPSQFRHPEFQYSFDVVNTKDLNAFALPGGFTYVNRGLIEAQLRSRADDFAMQHGEPSIRGSTPRAPRIRNRSQLVDCRPALPHSLMGDGRCCHAIGPDAAPPAALLRCREAPG